MPCPRRLHPPTAHVPRSRCGLILALGLLGCGGARAGIGSPARASIRISERVLAHMMAVHENGPAADAAVVCVALGPLRRRSDPDPLFLGRFKDARPPVRPWSECALDASRDDRLVHVMTGDSAIGYTIDWPASVTARRVYIGVAYYIAAVDAAGYVCEVVLDDDWRVESCKRTWIA